MGGVQQVLQEIHATLQAQHAEQLRQTFLLHCAAVTLGILWGALTWALVCLSKNEKEFL